MKDIVRRMSVLAACAAVAGVAAAPAAAQDDLEDWQRQELRSLLEVIEAALDGDIVPDGEPFQLQPDFLKGTDGETYVPFTVAIDPARFDGAALAMYIFVTDDLDPMPMPDDERHLAIFEDAFFSEVSAPPAGEPIRVSRALAVPGGTYDVYVALRESASHLAPTDRVPGDSDRARIEQYCADEFPDEFSGRVACQEQEFAAHQRMGRPRLSYDEEADAATLMMVRTRVDVPDLWADTLQTSTIIFPELVEPLPAPLTAEEQILNPYTLGLTRIVPKFDRNFGKQDELSLIFLVYNPRLGDGDKPDVTVQYDFHTRTADGGEEYFNQTNPQEFNQQTLPPDFDIEAGHQIVAGQTVPLSLFPAGDYRLQITVIDNAGEAEIVRDVLFTVLES